MDNFSHTFFFAIKMTLFGKKLYLGVLHLVRSYFRIDSYPFFISWAENRTKFLVDYIQNQVRHHFRSFVSEFRSVVKKIAYTLQRLSRFVSLEFAKNICCAVLWSVALYQRCTHVRSCLETI